MKTNVKTLAALFIAAFMISSCGLLFQSDEERAQEEKEMAKYIEKAVKDSTIVIDIDRVFPTPEFIDIMPGEYSFTIDHGKLTARLPFFGSGADLLFDSSDLSYHWFSEPVEFKPRKKKGSHSIEFTVYQDTDPVNIEVRISSDGYASIYINSMRRSMMTYYGTIVMNNQD